MQGFNMGRYYPPDATDPPRFNQSSHPLGARARKLAEGVLIVRFELPFAVWCGHCAPAALLAQGVRFNAEKRRVGAYHTTPIWSFRIKHGACGGWLEIRTDPQHAEYVVTEGGRRRDYGEGKEGDEEGAFGEVLTEVERERRRTDAFARLEGAKADEERAAPERQRVAELARARERDWDDPYAANRRVRRQFRAERKVREEGERETEAIRERIGWDGEILAGTAEDQQRAALVEFGERQSLEDDVARVHAKPMLLTKGRVADESAPGSTLRTKAAATRADRAARLQERVRHNTRAALDPFAQRSTEKSTSAARAIIGVKRRGRSPDHGPDARSAKVAAIQPDPAIATPTEKSAPDLGLTGYDSDD